MTQINFTLDFEKLKVEIGQSSLNDVVKSSLVIILNAYMERERDLFIQAGAHERSSSRTDYRNGYYEREMIMTPGRIRIKVPRTRSGEFATDVFEKYARCDKALLISILEMVVNGVSTRKVTNIIEDMCGESVSKAMVSNLMKKLDPVIKEWAERPLGLMHFRYIYADAMYIKVREHHKVVSKAVYIAMGVNEQNKREILGLMVGHSESEANWSEFFKSLISRGLQSPKLIISDAHSGLKAAISKQFIGTSWQRCTFHLLHNIIKTMPKKGSREARSLLSTVFKAANLEEARRLRDRFIDTYENQIGYQKAIVTLDEGFDDATQFYAEPENYHINIRTTNVLERLNQELRRREKVIRIFPNQQSAFRLMGAILMDYAETLDRGGRTYLKKTTD